MNMTRDEVGKQLVSQFTRLHTHTQNFYVKTRM